MITVAFANLAALEARATIIFYRPLSGTRRLQILPSLIFTDMRPRDRVRVFRKRSQTALFDGLVHEMSKSSMWLSSFYIENNVPRVSI